MGIVKSFVRGVSRAGNAVYKGIDAVAAGGYLPGGADPLHETIGGPLKRGASSAWDVLSGERDWRRQKALQEETWRREDTAVQRGQRDLAGAGINPMLAGQYGGAPTSAPTARSHSAESVGRIASLAGGILTGSVNAKKTLTELGSIRANTANTVADTAHKIAMLPHDQNRALADIALKQAMVPDTQAGTALKLSQRKQTDVRTEQMRHEMPEFAAKADYFKRYGRSGVLARELRNPWQATMLVSDQAARGPITSVANSAAAILNKAMKNVHLGKSKPRQRGGRAR